MYGFAIKKFGRALRLADWDFETLETKPLCVTQDHCGPAVFHLHRKFTAEPQRSQRTAEKTPPQVSLFVQSK